MEQPIPKSDSTPSDADNDLKAASAAEKALPPSPSSSAVSSKDVDQVKNVQDTTTAKSADQSQSSPAALPDINPADNPQLTKEELIEEALNCPCIASMKEGSCGDPFIAAYRCFLESETEPKGMDCMDKFKSMQTCISEHPEEYNYDDEDGDIDADADRKPSAENIASPFSEQKDQPSSNPSTQHKLSDTLSPTETNPIASTASPSA